MKLPYQRAGFRLRTPPVGKDTCRDAEHSSVPRITRKKRISSASHSRQSRGLQARSRAGSTRQGDSALNGASVDASQSQFRRPRGPPGLTARAASRTEPRRRFILPTDLSRLVSPAEPSRRVRLRTVHGTMNRMEPPDDVGRNLRV